MSFPTDPGRLGAAWRATTRSAQDCPSADALLALAAGELDAPARAELAAHIAACARCAAALQALAGFAAEDEKETMHAAAAPAAARRGPRALPIGLAAAAMLLIAVLVAPRLQQYAPPQLRGTTAVEAVQPPARAVLAAAPQRLQWRSALATPRRVRVIDAQARELWRSEPVAGDFADVPDEVRALMQPGASYAWELLPERDAAAAGPFWFTVQP